MSGRHVTASGRGARQRRMLLLTFFFPPNAAVGAIRWARLASLAIEAGWAVDVITLDRADMPAADEHRLALVAPEIVVHGVRFRLPTFERLTQRTWRMLRAVRVRVRRTPRAAESAATRSASDRRAAGPAVRGAPRHGVLGLGKRAVNAIVSVQHVRPWARAVVRRALALARHRRFDVVITSGPPHMTHLAGRAIARRLGVPHVVDYRDPWALVERLPDDYDSPLWRVLARHHERRVLRDARLVVTNTPAAAEAMRTAYPKVAERVVTVMNGTDDDAPPTPAFGSRFLVAFAGTIYLDRDPRLFLRAAGRVARGLGLAPADFGIRFIGNVEQYGNSHLAEIAAEEGVDPYLEISPFLPRAEALRSLAEAQVLLSLPQDNHSAIPAKVFEYTTFSAWMLVLAASGSATEMLLRGTTAFVVEPDDVDGMCAALLAAYESFRAGVRPEPADADGRFSRRTQARILFDALDGVVPVLRP